MNLLLFFSSVFSAGNPTRRRNIFRSRAWEECALLSLYLKYLAYAFCTSRSENSKQLAQILYPFGTGKPVSNQNRLSSSPMLSGSLTHATLLLPSEMFNRIPQSLGLEEHPQSAYFTGNVVCWKCSWLYETVDWLRCTLRLINLTLRSTPSINKNVGYWPVFYRPLSLSFHPL